MKKLFIVANWKANITKDEATSWLQHFKEDSDMLRGEFEQKEVVVCPSFPVISQVKSYVDSNSLPLRIGSQDISRFGKGAYTGEVPGGILHEFIQFSIVGHSERREKFGETDEVVHEKAANVISANLLPIFCVQSERTRIPSGVSIVAYEPVGAIGTGNPDSPQNAERVAKQIKADYPDVEYVLYGGSVSEENVRSFTMMDNINGVLVGSASLDPAGFARIIKNA